jgi:rhamnosyltransferase
MVAAIIVVFHPDIDLLGRSLRNISKQVATIYVADNTPSPTINLVNLLRVSNGRVRHLALGFNRGLAEAQNIGIRECLRGGFTHVLFFDQDSVPPLDLTQKLLEAERDLIASGVQVAAVGPLFVDKKTQQLSYAIRYRWFRVEKVTVYPGQNCPVESDWLISSGSLVRTSVLRTVGLMKDELFIDWVDAEWGLRARRAGFKSYMVPQTVMEHSVGDASSHLLGYTFNLHGLTRNYYIVRNATYLLFRESTGRKWSSAMLLRIPKHILVHTAFSKIRWQSFGFMMRGLVDGLRGRLGPFTN